MRGNLGSKLGAHGTRLLELWGGQEGLEKPTKKRKKDQKMHTQNSSSNLRQNPSLCFALTDEIY